MNSSRNIAVRYWHQTEKIFLSYACSCLCGWKSCQCSKWGTVHFQYIWRKKYIYRNCPSAKRITLWTQVRKKSGGTLILQHTGLYAYFLVYSYLPYKCESLKAKTSAERIKFKGRRGNCSRDSKSSAVQRAFLKRHVLTVSHRRRAEPLCSLFPAQPAAALIWHRGSWNFPYSPHT